MPAAHAELAIIGEALLVFGGVLPVSSAFTLLLSTLLSAQRRNSSRLRAVVAVAPTAPTSKKQMTA